ncbi:MAG: hypothetical protein LBC91_03945 [Candidatus Accumulibacter sp.]|nr:hypothetical protein [Accumulibacter sp.]
MSPATKSVLPPARPFRRRLAHHLIVVLAVKLVLLALLWHTFIWPNKVTVDTGVMGERLAGALVRPSSAARASMPTSPGDDR